MLQLYPKVICPKGADRMANSVHMTLIRLLWSGVVWSRSSLICVHNSQTAPLGGPVCPETKNGHGK